MPWGFEAVEPFSLREACVAFASPARLEVGPPPRSVHCPPRGFPAGTRGWLGLYFASSSARRLRPPAISALSSFTSSLSAASARRSCSISAASAASSAARALSSAACFCARSRASAGITSAGSTPGFIQRAMSGRIHIRQSWRIQRSSMRGVNFCDMGKNLSSFRRTPGPITPGVGGYGWWCSGGDEFRTAVVMGPGVRRDDGGGLFHPCGLELLAGTVFPECRLSQPLLQLLSPRMPGGSNHRRLRDSQAARVGDELYRALRPIQLVP